MRIMLDTNILISTFVFQSATMHKLIDLITDGHTIVLPSYAIEELKIVVKRKFPAKYMFLDEFLRELPFELAYTPDIINADNYPYIRDQKDLPILVSAINEDVDILITGDKDFSDIEIEKPEILTTSEFLERFS
jgi:putative PIN family toxin of toxin-antitoxin system